MSSIITPSDLNSYTQKTLATAVAKQVVDAANAYIERVTHRCWGDSVTVKEVCDYAPRIWLRHQDVTAISSVKFGYFGADPVDIESDSYHFNSLGRLTFGSYRAGRRHYADFPEWLEVTYTYGVDEVPEDLKLAALAIAAGFYNWAVNEQKEIVSAQVGSYRISYGGSAQSGEPNNDANWAVIKSYATKRF